MVGSARTRGVIAQVTRRANFPTTRPLALRGNSLPVPKSRHRSRCHPGPISAAPHNAEKQLHSLLLTPPRSILSTQSRAISAPCSWRGEACKVVLLLPSFPCPCAQWQRGGKPSANAGATRQRLLVTVGDKPAGETVTLPDMAKAGIRSSPPSSGPFRPSRGEQKKETMMMRTARIACRR